MEFIDDLKIIWRFLSKYKKQFYIIAFLAVLVSVIEAIIPYFYGRIVDAIISGKKFSILAGIMIFWFFLILIKDFCSRYYFINGLRISIKCTHDFIVLLNRHALRLNLNYHKQHKSGKLSSKYIRASDALEDILNNVALVFVPNMMAVFFSLLAIALLVHWLIFLVVFIYILIYFLITIKYSRLTTECIIKMVKSYEEIFGFIHDAIANIQTVKANSREDFENKQVETMFKEKTQVYNQEFTLNLDKLIFFQNLASAVSFLAVFSLAAILVRNGSITVGQVVAMIAYLGILSISKDKVGKNMDTFRRWMGTVKIGYRLLDEEIEPYDKKSAIVLWDARGDIEFKDICFNYHETREILKNISFKAKSGQVIALVGESGVGKSTLMDLLSRYNIPTSGKIFFDGIDIQKIDLRNLRKQIAIVPQEVSLFNDSLKNNILYAKPGATDDEVWDAIKTANAEEFVNAFPDKLNQEVGERGIKLSTGQKQRVAIARAVLKNPKILVLDEATSALDSKSELLVQEALKKLIKGRTTFVIAHRLSTIQHADKILVLDKGQIAEEGKHEELIEKRGLYYKLFTLQSLGESEEDKE